LIIVLSALNFELSAPILSAPILSAQRQSSIQYPVSRTQNPLPHFRPLGQIIRRFNQLKEHGLFLMSDIVASHKIVSRFYLHLLNHKPCDKEIFLLLSKCCRATEQFIFGGKANSEGDPDNLNVEEERTDGL